MDSLSSSSSLGSVPGVDVGKRTRSPDAGRGSHSLTHELASGGREWPERSPGQLRASPGGRWGQRRKCLHKGALLHLRHGRAGGDRHRTGCRRLGGRRVCTGVSGIRNLKAPLLVSALLPQRQPTVVRSGRGKHINQPVKFDEKSYSNCQ